MPAGFSTPDRAIVMDAPAAGCARAGLPRRAQRALRLRSLAAMLAVSAAVAGVACSRDSGWAIDRTARPNIVLVVVDTLRADHFGSGGGGAGRPKSVFDRLRSEGAYFENAYATASWTTPSTVSIFLSQYPSQHGSTTWLSPLSDTGPSFVESLQRAGYRTGGWSANFLITEERGFQRGFDAFELVKHPEWTFGIPPQHPAAFAGAGDLLAKATAWLDEGSASAGGSPFFLYLHWMEPHTPYLCPPIGGEACHMLSTSLNRRLMSLTWEFNESEAAFVRDFYRADVNRVESALDDLIGALAERGLSEKTWLIVTADHGEMLGEHELYVHGHALHEETLRVPLLIRPPKAPRPLEVGALVSLIDLAPTILDLAGVDAPGRFGGRSLVPVLRGGALPARPVVAELFPMREDMGPLYRHLLAVVDGSTKYLVAIDGGVQRFDLSQDAREENPQPASLSDLQPELAKAGVRFHYEEALKAPSLDLSPEVADQLRALGYLQP